MINDKKSKLKAVVPEKIEKRLKLFLYGQSGIGKTTAALQFPNAYIIDLERGTDYYAETIKKSGSVVFQSNDYHDIKEQIEALLTEEHPYKTLIIDPITVLYQSIQDVWTNRFEKDAKEKNKSESASMQDFGMRYWGKVKGDYKSLQRLIIKLDMNVIVTAHQKDVYGQGFSKIGVTFDSMKNDDYFFDNVFRLEKRGKERFALTEKERAEIGKNKFPEDFPWSYENFLKFYGTEAIERQTKSIPLATPKQVAEIMALIDTIKIPDAIIEKWFIKADVDNWGEMTNEQIQLCIDFCHKKASALDKSLQNGGKK